MASSPGAPLPTHKLVAPLWHTLGLLLLLLAISLGLLHMQTLKLAAGEQHRGNVILYLLVILSEWVLSFYIWLGGWYQGVKMVIVITVLGVLFGIFTHWRKSLRPGMMAHAWGDIVNLIG